MIDGEIKLYFDGSCWPNPGGEARYGYVVKLDNCILHEGNGYIGSGYGMSCNVAEYVALMKALEYLKEKEMDEYKICAYGDSKLVVDQMSGKRKAKSGFYIDYYEKTKRIKDTFRHFKIKWIPRCKNTRADFLSKLRTDTIYQAELLDMQYRETVKGDKCEVSAL